MPNLKLPFIRTINQIVMKRTALDDYVVNKIREIREEMGISQEALSYMMNYRSNIVAKAKRGDMNYHIRHIYLIALALKKAPGDFFPDKPITPLNEKPTER